MMKRIIKYLGDLQANNNREWFKAHKAEYEECKAMFETFTERLIAGIREFDDTIGALTAKECTYRIYRDTRFSADKTPYKTHMGCFIVPGGKESGYSGYYLQVGPNDKGYPGGCMLATGDYCCDPRVLKVLREDLASDSDGLFAQALATAHDFRLDYEGALKRVPHGFAADQPYSQWLRLRSFCLLKEPGRDYMLSDNLIGRAVNDFRSTLPFLQFINRAVSYVREEA